MYKQDYKIVISADINGEIYWQMFRKGEPVACNEEEEKLAEEMLGEVFHKLEVNAFWRQSKREESDEDKFCQENCKGYQETGKCFADGGCDAKRKAEQNSAAWSEEDEEMIECLKNCLDELEKEQGWLYIYINNKDVKLNKVRNWLKLLKDRVQPKAELTQLDKNILEAAIAFVEQNDHFNYWRGVDKRTVLSALYSLRPQNYWKSIKGRWNNSENIVPTI